MKNNRSLIVIQALTALIMLSGMTLYEFTKQLLFPDIKIWESHVMTIIFSTIIAAAASFFVFQNRQKMLDILKTENAEKKKALDEKNLLFREINHRVKNNFQLVSSIIGIEKNKISDENGLACLNELQNRIRIMAQIHERLQRTDETSSIEFGSFIHLTANNMTAIYVNGDEIKINLETESIRLDVGQAVSLGLILTELLTNAFKYAFTDNKNGNNEIKIIFKLMENDIIRFSVSDNGRGIPYDIGTIPQKSLGLQIIKNLTEIHLDGNLDIERKNGTKFIITFKRAVHPE